MDHFAPLPDSNLPKNLQPVARSWRALTASLAYSGPVAWRVKSGFTLKAHAPNAGHCYKDFLYLQDWNFTDEPTREGIVFWIPRILPGSRGVLLWEQERIMLKIRKEYFLPEHHLYSFGSATLLAGLILACQKATDERIPFMGESVRTDTRFAIQRLTLGRVIGSKRELICGCWDYDEHHNLNLGIFPLGMESV